MRLTNLPYDILCHIVSFFDHTDYGVLCQMRLRQVSRFTSTLAVTLGFRCVLEISEYTIQWLMVRQRVPVWDLDDERMITLPNGHYMLLTKKNGLQFDSCLQKYIQNVDSQFVYVSRRAEKKLNKMQLASMAQNYASYDNPSFSTSEKSQQDRVRAYGMAILKALQQNTQVTHVSAKHMVFMTEEFYLLLAKILANGTITHLDLSYSHLSSMPMTTLLKHSYYLRYLNISCLGKLSSAQTFTLKELLCHSNSLQDLDISNTFFDREDSMPYLLPYLLAYSRTLEHFTMSVRFVAMEFCAHIAFLKFEQLKLNMLQSFTICFLDSNNGFFYKSINEHDLVGLYAMHNVVETRDGARRLSEFLEQKQVLCIPIARDEEPIAKLSKNEQRNQKRKCLLQEDMTCPYCGGMWRSGSMTLSTFETFKSQCKLGKKACADHPQYAHALL